MPRKPREEIVDADEAIRRYYESGPASESEGFRDGTEPVTPADERTGQSRHPDRRTADLSGGDVDVSAQDVDIGAEAPGGSNPTPDQDIVDDIGRAVGVMYEDNEPLKFGDKVAGRDEARWELNPASADDYQERREEEAGSAKRASKRPSSAPRKNTRTGAKPSRSKRSKS